jgi:acetoacetyl-CoA synthetase
MAKLLWSPSPTRIQQSNMQQLMNYITKDGHQVSNYQELYDFSIRLPQLFWRYVWDFGSFVESAPYTSVLENSDKMPGATWFKGSKINFAQNLLKFRDDRTAITSYNEYGKQQQLSYAQLFEKVARLSHWMKQQGVKPGDKVVGFMPNVPETIITMLAATSLGAIWSSCSPDFGLQGVLDRFGQIEAKIIMTTDGYFYGGKTLNSLDKLNQILPQLTSIEQIVVVPYVNTRLTLQDIKKQLPQVPNDKAINLFDVCINNSATDIDFAELPFDHPLYILYSSGTTGAPKCIVHSAGGTLLQHYKELAFHTDVKPDDVLFYYTTCGWMMWNWMVSTLMTGAGLVIFDGSPFFPGPDVLWKMAQQEKISIFGCSAKYISHLEKLNFLPKQDFDLKHLKTVLSTGSPLSHESFEFVYREIKQDVCLSSIAGGTDIISTFTLGCPILPVYQGEMQCIGLGMAVNIYDENGKPIDPASGEKGELVCSAPFPSMPIGFYGDAGNKKYLSSYFERFDNIWAQGDIAQLVPHSLDNTGVRKNNKDVRNSKINQTYLSVIIHGRSDATLNPGGVRIGTSEIYRQVEKIDAVMESIAVGQQWPKDSGDERVILFVTLRDELPLSDRLIQEIKLTIKTNTTPRHVPAVIIQVQDIPRTLSGKIVEVAVRETIHNRAIKNTDSLKNPEALGYFKNLTELEYPL